MVMDVRTLFAAVAVACVVNVAAITFIWLANRRVPGVGAWTLGSVFTGLSLPLFLFQGLVDNRLVTYVMPNFLHTVGVLCALAGALHFRGSSIHKRAFVLMGGLPFMAILWFLFGDDDRTMRVIVSSSWTAAIYLSTALLIWGDDRDGMRLSTRFVALGFGIACAGMSYRVVTWAYSPQPDLISGTEWANVLPAMVALVMSFVWTFTLHFLVNQYHLREVSIRIEAQHAIEQQLLEARHEIEKERGLKLRQHMARELHDGIGGITATMAMLANQSRVETEGETSELLARFEQMALVGTREIQGLMGSVENEIFRWADWLRDLEGYAGRIMEMASISFEWKVEGEVPVGIIRDPSRAASLKKVAYEAIHNLVRHSGAEKCSIRVVFQGGHIALSIRDDGHGFTAVREGGRGVSNMRQRMEEIGGDISIRSDKGTVVKLDAPVEAVPVTTIGLVR